MEDTGIPFNEVDEYGFFKGTIRVTMEYISEEE